MTASQEGKKAQQYAHDAPYPARGHRHEQHADDGPVQCGESTQVHIIPAFTALLHPGALRGEAHPPTATSASNKPDRQAAGTPLQAAAHGRHVLPGLLLN